MLTKEQLRYAQARACEYLDRAGMVLTADEINNIEVADFGLVLEVGRRVNLKIRDFQAWWMNRLLLSLSSFAHEIC